MPDEHLRLVSEPGPRYTWRRLITALMAKYGESWADVEAHEPVDYLWLDAQFDCDYGHIDGPPFTLWTRHRVYFPAVYDGAEWVESVPRHPDGTATEHIGMW